MKAYNADLAISIHIDSSQDSSLRGATAYLTTYPKLNAQMQPLANLLLTNLSKLGIKSNGIKTRVNTDNDGFFDDGTPVDYYGILKYPTLYKIPTVLLEHCYLSNSEDCKFIDSDEDLRKIAKADSDAIAAYLKLVKKNANTNVKVTQTTKIDGVTISNLEISKGYITNITARSNSFKSKI